jgi:hypothetical protein
VRPVGRFTTYNDFAWVAGQLRSNITTHTTAAGGGGGDGGGPLVDFAAGQPTGVQLTISGGAYYGDWQGELGRLAAPGTDAYAVFNDRVDCRGYLSYASSPLVLAFSGLDPAEAHEVVLFGNRDNAPFSNRLTIVTIEGATAFLNASTPGAVITGPGGATTTLANGDNTAAGLVARYTDVRSALDGTFRLTIPAADSTEAGRYYVNALMLRAQPASTAARLHLARSTGGQLILAWTCAACVLEEGPTLDGPWQPSASQSNPQFLLPAAASTFYRLRQP